MNECRMVDIDDDKDAMKEERKKFIQIMYTGVLGVIDIGSGHFERFYNTNLRIED